MKRFSAPLLILFDGECMLCHGFLRFVASRDPHKYFRFVPIESAMGKMLLHQFKMHMGTVSTVALVEHNHLFTKSTAVLRIMKRLKIPWSLLYSGILIPQTLRDKLYVFIACRRYRWFGKYKSCPMPEFKLRDRFLE